MGLHKPSYEKNGKVEHNPLIFVIKKKNGVEATIGIGKTLAFFIVKSNMRKLFSLTFFFIAF